jgi:uncharacterized lipoprotein YehR (DUF1307 family)
MKNRIFSVLALASMVSLVACGGGEEAATAEGEGKVVDTNTEMVTTQDTQMVTTPVVTTDTAAVQTTTIVEADTTVRTEVVPAPATGTPAPATTP